MRRPSSCLMDSCRRCIIGVFICFWACCVNHAARVVFRSMLCDELSAVFRFLIWSFSSVSWIVDTLRPPISLGRCVGSFSGTPV